MEGSSWASGRALQDCAPVLRTTAAGRFLLIPTANKRRDPARRMTTVAPLSFAAAATLATPPG